MKTKTIVDYPLMKAWMKYAKKNNFCEQCIHPWFDGICSCDNSDAHWQVAEAIINLAIQEGYLP